MKRKAYILAQAVWGFPQTLMGAAVFAANRRQPHFRYHGAVVTSWRSRSALSLGPFIFLGSSADEKLLVHEYGHTVQSLVLGPLYLPVIGLPSVMWFNMPACKRKRRRERLSYYSFFTERSANWLGERVLGEPSVGQLFID